MIFQYEPYSNLPALEWKKLLDKIDAYLAVSDSGYSGWVFLWGYHYIHVYLAFIFKTSLRQFHVLTIDYQFSKIL